MKPRVTLRRLLAAWTIIATAAWFVLGGIAAKQEADCYASGNFLCSQDASFAIFLFVGLYVAVLWAIGAVLLFLGYAVVVDVRRERRRRRAAR